MITVGLTGSMGSGKSTVAKLFEAKGVPVFYGDEAGRTAEKDPEIRKAFLKIVGDDVLVDGEIDRAKMRARVFNDKAILAQVNAIMEPAISKMFRDFIEKATADGENVVVMESAILFESQANKGFDYIVSVVADKHTRFKRVMNRDKVDESIVWAKMNVQSTDDFKVKNSDFIIVNNDFEGCDSTLLLEMQLKPILLMLMSAK